MKFSKILVLGAFLAGTLTAPALVSVAGAHGNGNSQGNSKHNFCYDKHGRWRSHPHCPAPQPVSSPRYYSHPRPHYAHYHHGNPRPCYDHSHHPHYTGGYYQRRPQVIYVKKDSPYDHRHGYTRPPVRDTRASVSDARRDVQQGRDQLKLDRSELKKDRAELRRDIRNGASKQEIRTDRQEIRADLQKVRSTRQDIRNDRRELELARR